ncbi:class I SAM-dependent methyltransferase [Cellulomonas soli]|uniref:Methyltransferase type 11 n=1 Tax=Cellulomonas soli TaxID=931535 RepID=A0A512PCC9_9CELL|nr:methyltransferase domain-containing protein [Cellulomonas soli]GEP68863.1 methyltransferase type 11 [Cellulomonas soli]
MHFERMAEDYAAARPPYPEALFEELTRAGVLGAGVRVLEVGAGAGLATAALVAAGCEVTAVEPGRRLATLLSQSVPGATVVNSRLEDVELPGASIDSAVAATSMHWVDLAVGLPLLHGLLRPGGRLAVWRMVFGDPSVRSPFRELVDEVVARRPAGRGPAPRGDLRPTMDELAAGGWFEPLGTTWWRWTAELSSERVRRLFATFSDWSPEEVEAAAQAADTCGGTVTEHFGTVLHLLRAAPRASAVS